jgi:phytoene dehydrogenase-like protein
MKVAIVGGGVGGLAAGARLAMLGHRVQIFEARDDVGGLASGFQAGGVWFDGGPYIVLDRPGLEWALEKLALDVGALRLQPATDFYTLGDTHIYLDLQRTVEEMGASGPAYKKFVLEMNAIRTRLEPLLRVSHPNAIELARRGALGVAPFLLRSLASVLKQLPREIVDAVAIWTHIAGQSIDEAPSVMAFVPALIHCVGAFVPAGGMRAIPELLAENARRVGVEIHCNKAIRKIAEIEADAVISNYNGIGTYDELVDVPDRVRNKLRAMPLQSPGLCAYLTAKSEGGPYLRFRLSDAPHPAFGHPLPKGEGEACGAPLPSGEGGAQRRVRGLELRVTTADTVRMIMPFDRETSEAQQEEALQRMLDDPWWREGLSDVKLVRKRTVRGWGRDMHLYRDSMNPAMTRRMMLRGRLPHRSPWVKGLYLAGASTHPGQWVSFCAISGILAAEMLHADHAAGSI